MPSASDELREQMNEYFGDPISDYGPKKYLQDQGYTLNRDWSWSKPGITELKQMERKEFECLMFLVHEWDGGTLK